MDNIDWTALGVVYAGFASEPSPTPEVIVLALSIDSETELELAEERAAIMEFDGDLPRFKAEAYAFRTIKPRKLFTYQ